MSKSLGLIVVGLLASCGGDDLLLPSEGAPAAIVVIALLQVILTFLIQRLPWLSDIVKARPTMLVHKGRYIEKALRKTRVSKPEICGALRQHGLTRIEDATWVILETDGSMTVISGGDGEFGSATALGNVERLDDEPSPQPA